MIHRLLYPATVQGKVLHFALVAYLSISIIGCTAPQPTVKPPTTIARAMETRTFSKDMKTVLKAAINALQDMDYTINVLNSDVGLITASRTTEQKKSELAWCCCLVCSCRFARYCVGRVLFLFFFNDTATTEIYTILFVGSVRLYKRQRFRVSRNSLMLGAAFSPFASCHISSRSSGVLQLLKR